MKISKRLHHIPTKTIYTIDVRNKSEQEVAQYIKRYKIKLSQWAKEQGISYRTAWNWFKTGKMPVKTVQMKTGTILVDVSAETNGSKI